VVLQLCSFSGQRGEPGEVLPPDNLSNSSCLCTLQTLYAKKSQPNTRKASHRQKTNSLAFKSAACVVYAFLQDKYKEMPKSFPVEQILSLDSNVSSKIEKVNCLILLLFIYYNCYRYKLYFPFLFKPNNSDKINNNKNFPFELFKFAKVESKNQKKKK